MIKSMANPKNWNGNTPIYKQDAPGHLTENPIIEINRDIGAKTITLTMTYRDGTITTQVFEFEDSVLSKCIKINPTQVVE